MPLSETLEELRRNLGTPYYALPVTQILSVSFGENSWDKLTLFEEMITTYYGAKRTGPARIGLPNTVDYISFVFTNQASLDAARRDWNLPEELIVGKVTYLGPQPE